MKNSKKIYFLSISLGKGGAENQLVRLAIYLRNKGYDVQIIYAISENDFEEELCKNNILIHKFKYDSFKGIINLSSFIKLNRPDLIISFMFGANLAARFLKFRFKIPIITSVRSYNISKFYKFLYRASYKLDNFTIFNSQFAKERFTKKRLAESTKSFYIPNAIVVNHIEKEKNSSRVFTLLSIAHFRPAKDYKTLFEGIKLLRDKNIQIKLIVLGKTLGQTWPYEMLEKYGIIDDVEIVGFVSNPQLYLSKADALILSTHWEGTPNAVLEAMANKIPVVTSDIPICKDIIQNASCGYVFAKKNPNDVCSKLEALMALTNEQRKVMGNNGYNYILKNYEEKRVYEQWQEVIDKVL